MIKGVTPIETAFEMIGLVNSQALMKWIFFDTLGGALVFGAGLATSLMIAVEKGSFKAVWTFLILFFVAFFLFVIPTARVDSFSSTMEQQGFEGMSTKEIMQEQGYGEFVVNPVLNVISDFMSAFSIGLVGVLDNMASGGQFGYLKNPFLLTKMVTLVNETVMGGITDPPLRKDVIDFFQSEYLPTLQLFMERNKTVKDLPDLWPGAQEVRAAYSPETREAWDALKDRLAKFLSKDMPAGVYEAWKAGVQKGANQKDPVEVQIMALLKYDIKKNPTAYANQAWEHKGFANVSSDVAGKKSFWGWVGGWVSDTGALLLQPTVVSISHFMLHVAPYVQGYCLMLMFTFFPFTILWTVLTRDPKIMLEFCKNLFWVKSWTLCWGVVNIASVYVWEIQRLLQSSSGMDAALESPYFLMITSVFMIATPVVTYSLLTGHMTGLGIVATMANLHADKGVEMAQKNISAAGGGAGQVGGKAINHFFTPKGGQA